MYNPDARKEVRGTTVFQLCAYLIENVSMDAIVHVCGEDIFYLHVEEDGSVLSLDDNSLSDMPEYDGSEPELLVVQSIKSDVK